MDESWCSSWPITTLAGLMPMFDATGMLLVVEDFASCGAMTLHYSTAGVCKLIIPRDPIYHYIRAVLVTSKDGVLRYKLDPECSQDIPPLMYAWCTFIVAHNFSPIRQTAPLVKNKDEQVYPQSTKWSIVRRAFEDLSAQTMGSVNVRDTMNYAIGRADEEIADWLREKALNTLIEEINEVGGDMAKLLSILTREEKEGVVGPMKAARATYIEYVDKVATQHANDEPTFAIETLHAKLRHEQYMARSSGGGGGGRLIQYVRGMINSEYMTSDLCKVASSYTGASADMNAPPIIYPIKELSSPKLKSFLKRYLWQ